MSKPARQHHVLTGAHTTAGACALELATRLQPSATTSAIRRADDGFGCVKWLCGLKGEVFAEAFSIDKVDGFFSQFLF